MRYTVQQYASALYQAVRGKSKEEEKETIRRFMEILQRCRETPKLARILRSIEEIYLREHGLKKVAVESASPLSEEVRVEIERILGKEISLHETVSPTLGAGVKILVNDELLIDASAKRQIERLFGGK